MLILAIIGFGMFAGWLAQVILGDSDQINWGLALGSGIGGSFLFGAISSMLGSEGFELRPAGLIGTVLGAIVVSFGWQLFHRRSRQSGAGRR